MTGPSPNAMRVAVVSDIHGNRHAFEAVLAEVAEAEVEEMWCLGDLVGYGAEPDACVALAAEHADLCLDVQRHRVCLIGHSHVALSFSRDEGEAATGEARRGGTELDISEGEWMLNPGSVGQPRDGDPRAAWMVLDTEDWTAEYRRTDYDIGGAGAAIRAAHLPDSLAERLFYGQ